SPTVAADPRRGSPLRGRLSPPAPGRTLLRLDLRRAGGRRSGPPPCPAPALRLGGALPRGHPGRARGGSWRPGEDCSLDLRAATQSRPRLNTPVPRWGALSQAIPLQERPADTW